MEVNINANIILNINCKTNIIKQLNVKCRCNVIIHIRITINDMFVLPLMCNTRTGINNSIHNQADAVFDVVLRQTDRGAAGYDAVARAPDHEHCIFVRHSW